MIEENNKTELIISDVTLYEPKSKKKIINSGTYDTYNTERILSLIKSELVQNRNLLLSLNVIIVLKDKRVRLTQWGGGIPVRSIQTFNDVLVNLKELVKKLIEAGKFEEYYFSNKEGYEILTINGEQSIEKVHQDIIKALGY